MIVATAGKVYRVTIERQYRKHGSLRGGVLTGEDVSIQWKHSKVQRRIRKARIRLEAGKDPQKCYYGEKRLLAKSNTQPSHVTSQMQPKDPQKKFSE